MENKHSPINLSGDVFRKHGYYMIDRIAELLESFRSNPVTRASQPAEINVILGDRALPLEGTPLEKVFEDAVSILLMHSLFNGHPKFLGYITSSPAPAGILADLLASAVNANVGAYVLSPAATQIEKQCLRWIAELIGYPSDASGIFVSGGNMANITGLMAARRAMMPDVVRSSGLSGRQLKVYCAAGTHTWIDKAADLLGFGTDHIRKIVTDDDERIDVDELERQIIADRAAGYFPLAVVGTSGYVGSGSVDRLDALADVCERHNVWFHIDGAYGAPAAALPENAVLFRGISRANSIAIDPHKWLYSPLEAGCILVRDPQALQQAFSFNPPYYNFNPAEGEPVTNFHEHGVQNSRGFRALKVWTTLRQLGRKGYIELIRRDMNLAACLFALIQNHDELEAVTQHLSVVTFRYVPKDYKKLDSNESLNTLNTVLLNDIQRSGYVFLSNAIIQQKYCLRACFVNFRTTPKDITDVIQTVVSQGRLIAIRQLIAIETQ